MKARYISLFFASIGVRQVVRLLFAWGISVFRSASMRRLFLSKKVQKQLGLNASVFAYSSGRAALAASLRAAGIGSGDKVLLSSYTCLAVPTAVIAVGAHPIYLDIDPLTLNVPTERMLTAMQEPGVRAVVAQHTLGCIAEVEPIVLNARKHGILVIEDCALSIGSSRAGLSVGCVGDAAIFSMELSKTISSGWGGILVVNNDAHARSVAEDYCHVPEAPFLKTTQRVWQTAISAMCYTPFLFPVGRYVLAAAFRYGFFRSSTSEAEAQGRPESHFIERLSGPQAVLAAEQWKRLAFIKMHCQKNLVWLREAIAATGFCVLGRPDVKDVVVAPRVAFAVADRERFIKWFAIREVDIGLWFDGPLSPRPSQAVFAYDVAMYPNADIVARHVVNFASHFKLRMQELERMLSLLEAYARAYPEETKFSKWFSQASSGFVKYSKENTFVFASSKAD